jgi:hypothetical protein
MRMRVCWLGAASLIVFIARAQSPDAYTWTAVGPMGTARADACAVLLQDGRALVIGGTGSDGSALASAEFFNSDNTYTPAPSLNAARAQQSCTALPDGRVLVAGGSDGQGNAIGSAEIFDPAAQAWQPIAGLNEARWGHTATLLPNGRVLLAGGCDANGPKASLELFDPVANQFTGAAGTLSSPRMNFAAALLQTGRVLLLGGSDGAQSLASTDIFDPATATASPGPNLLLPRAGLTANTLLDGTVLVVGGNDGNQDLASAEIFDPGAQTFSFNFGSPTVPRSGHQAFVIPNNGNVLIVGGMSNGSATAQCELYTFQGEFMPVGSTGTPRAHAAGIAIGPGKVLTAGGSNDAGVEARSGVNLGQFFVFELSFENNVSFTSSVGVSIMGSGFRAGEFVNSYLTIGNGAPQTLSTATADSNGNFTSFTSLSNETSGTWTVHSQGQSSGSVLTASSPVVFSAVSLSFSCNPCLVGQPLTITATAMAAPAGATGTIGAGHTMSFSDGSTSLGTVGVSPNPNGTGTALFSTATLPAGSHSIAAIFRPSGSTGIGPDGFIQSASVVQGLTVNKTASKTTVTVSPNPARAGLFPMLTATIAFAAGIPPSGSVTFFQGTAQLSPSWPVNSSGTATVFLQDNLAAGTYSFTATYSGDANYTGSTSPAASLVIIPKITPTVNLTVAPSPARAGSQVSLTVRIPAAGGNPTPTGAVTFFDGSTQLGTAAFSTDGVAGLPVTFATTGTHSLTATYAGDANYLSATSAAVSLVVNPKLTATVTGGASPNPFTISNNLSLPEVTIAATISYPAGAPAPTGTVTFRTNSTGVATVPISTTISSTSVGAILKVAPGSKGTFSLTATYNGDVNYDAATSKPFALTVN